MCVSVKGFWGQYVWDHQTSEVYQEWGSDPASVNEEVAGGGAAAAAVFASAALQFSPSCGSRFVVMDSSLHQNYLEVH